ncbi:hypothetical protein [Sphingomonas sp.]|uniref:hypothetical protein n=1 Tax=Sphingomonas sp. TaxID=28214 RepID=UPI0025F1110F|nr:hypothetical protein [Sphingomonas sp.]MBV9528617.1 hypothetical protein [Sphingomonas sp.]MBV9841705.1 hypothetical protein [Sphingomonadaceae bacterium]
MAEPRDGGKEARARRLAQALRDNLRRRKAQAREGVTSNREASAGKPDGCEIEER